MDVTEEVASEPAGCSASTRVAIDWDILAAHAVTEADIRAFLPPYLERTPESRATIFAGLGIAAFQRALRLGIFLAMRPVVSKSASLDQAEVDRAYHGCAASYDWKHHFITRGMDTQWRREAGWFTLATSREIESGATLRVLDLSTGTGLTAEAIADVLSRANVPAQVVGLDYNESMLAIARRREGMRGNVNVVFVRGDACRLALPSGDENLEDPMHESFNAVTHVFGTGCIARAESVFDSVLRVLRPGGRYFLVDVHRPLAWQAGEFPFGWRWWRLPRLESETFEQTTVPLVLKRLWAWRDTTFDFYRLRLATHRDAIGRIWGFRTLHFDVQSVRWWLGIPILPVGRISVEKVEIGEAEASKREVIRQASGL